MKGRAVLVTGGNSGIGRGIALRFAREGADVAIAGRDPAKCAAVEAELRGLGVEACHAALDLSVEADVERMIETVAGRLGRLDIVVNNAGFGGRRSGIAPDDSPGKRWDIMRGGNLDSGYFVSAHALPVMIGCGGTAIVNIASTATWHGNWGLYCMAKAGVEGMTRAFAAEAAPHGIRVNGVSPGWIATDPDLEATASGSADGSWEMPPSLLDRMGTPDEIAAAVHFLASDEASFITGQTLVVDGGMMTIDYPSRKMLEGLESSLQSGKGV